MPTLILTNRYTADSQALWRAATRRRWAVQRLGGLRVPEEMRAAPEPVIYAEALVAPVLAEQFGLALDDPAVEWLPSLPHEYLSRSVTLSTLAEARKITRNAFVKPPNDKSFPARVYFGSELPDDLPNDTPVLVAEVVEWEKEFRCFVLDRKLVTHSIYLRNGELQEESEFASSADEEAELQGFVARVLSDCRAPLLDAAALDVGVIRGKGWAVVEQNSAWGAGIYGCNADAMLDVLYRASGHGRMSTRGRES